MGDTNAADVKAQQEIAELKAAVRSFTFCVSVVSAIGEIITLIHTRPDDEPALLEKCQKLAADLSREAARSGAPTPQAPSDQPESSGE
jgi:hypothetical protein